MKILIPKNKHIINPKGGPLFFLAGPVRGGHDWQRDCYELLCQKLQNFYAAIPYYHKPGTQTFSLLEKAEPGESNLAPFARQLDWERKYMEIAVKIGCLIFYLPEESLIEARPKEEGPYATDTRGEIARWSVHKHYHPEFRMVVGAEPQFHGLSQIQRNLSADMGYEFPIYSSLEETVDAAIAEAISK